MKKTSLLISLVVLFFQIGISQTTTILNYDFNSSGSYPLLPNSTVSGVTCSASSTEPFQAYSGVATSSLAFVQNATAGNALAMSNSSGTNTRYFLFQLGGSDLNTYQSYKLYMQPQRSTTGATLVTVAYSTNGSSYTNLSSTYSVTASFTDLTIDLSSISAINNAASLYIKLMVSGTSATAGTIRIDNFQIQANKGTVNGSSNPWQVSGNDVGFMGKVGIGTNSPAFPLDVAGDTRLGSNLRVGGSLILGPSQPAINDPCLLKLMVAVPEGSGNGSNVLAPMTATMAQNLDALVDLSPCPTPPVIPFTWQTYGNHVTSNNRWIGTIENFDFNIKTNNTLRLVIKNNGQILFGTKKILANHPHANCQYQFDGKIGCKELVVVDPTKWADFVFDKNYKLLPLKDVEAYYVNNRHLPSVPSEKEVKENGINTAEMDAILLQKIEELTLYIVQQQKEIEALKKTINK